jgi:hypothetical protein
MTELQHLPGFRARISALSKSCDVTVTLTHAELPDKKSKSKLLHDVMHQGQGGMHLKATSIFRANF